MKNGELLRTVEAAAFEVMVTADASIKYQQNLKERKLALVALPTNDIERLQPIVPQIVAKVDAATPNSYQSLDWNPARHRGGRPFGLAALKSCNHDFVESPVHPLNIGSVHRDTCGLLTRLKRSRKRTPS